MIKNQAKRFLTPLEKEINTFKALAKGQSVEESKINFRNYKKTIQ